MVKEKVENNISVWEVFFEGLRIYCANIHKFLGYMAFPVLGQILGLGLTFGLTFLYSRTLPDLVIENQSFQSFGTILLTVVFIALPGMLIWAKAFWDFLVAYGALNSMTQGALTTGRVYDFKSHKQVVTKRTFSFIALWFLYGIFTALAAIPFFWVIGLILFVYFILIFQVFTFEEKTSPIGCFVRSFRIIKGNFAKTFGLALLLLAFTYWLLPAGVKILVEAFSLVSFLTTTLTPWVETLPLDAFYLIMQKARVVLAPGDVSGMLVNNTVGTIVVGFTLPLRSVCCSLWYKKLAEPVKGVNEPKKRVQKDVPVQEL
jgi:hypothetical protein